MQIGMHLPFLAGAGVRGHARGCLTPPSSCPWATPACKKHSIAPHASSSLTVHLSALGAWRQVQTCRARAWLHDAAERVLAGARLVRCPPALCVRGHSTASGGSLLHHVGSKHVERLLNVDAVSEKHDSNA